MPAQSKKTVRRKTPARSSRSDAISLLKKDHATVKQLLSSLEATTERATDRREKLLKQIETEIKTHSRLEEEIFYPAFKEAARKSDEHLYYEAVEEHGLVDIVLPDLKSTSSDSEKFSAKAKVLKDLIEHHAEEEETEMFPKARQVMSADELRELGKDIQARREQLNSTMLLRVATTAGKSIGRVLHRNKRAA
jgi:hemerythrin-like domain-containing protein